MATNFEGLTQEEIAGHFWDAQSTQIASGSEYAGTAGRAKFITDYSSSFQTYEDSGSKTILGLQDEMSAIQTSQVEAELDFFAEQELGNIQLEEKWWNDKGWTDSSGEYVESSVEMLTRQNDEMNDIMDRTRQDEINTIVKDFTETKESAQFKQQRTGVNVRQGTDELRATLWSEVEGVKDKYSDAKENSQRDLDRTVKDNKLNITRGYEDIEEGIERRELNITQAGESETLNNLGNKEEAMSGFGAEMWNTMRRLQNAGIFNEPIEDYVPPEDKSESGFLGIGDKDAQGNTIGTCVLSTAAYWQDLITKEQLMSFVSWRLRTQHKEFLGNAKWLGYQMAYAPVSRLMLKHKWVAKLMKKLVLDKWLGVIKGKRFPITKFIVEYIGLIGFIFNYKRAMALGKRLKGNPKLILQAYKDLIRLKEEGKYNG